MWFEPLGQHQFPIWEHLPVGVTSDSMSWLGAFLSTLSSWFSSSYTLLVFLQDNLWNLSCDHFSRSGPSYLFSPPSSLQSIDQSHILLRKELSTPQQPWCNHQSSPIFPIFTTEYSVNLAPCQSIWWSNNRAVGTSLAKNLIVKIEAITIAKSGLSSESPQCWHWLLFIEYPTWSYPLIL